MAAAEHGFSQRAPRGQAASKTHGLAYHLYGTFCPSASRLTGQRARWSFDYREAAQLSPRGPQLA